MSTYVHSTVEARISNQSLSKEIQNKKFIGLSSHTTVAEQGTELRKLPARDQQRDDVPTGSRSSLKNNLLEAMYNSLLLFYSVLFIFWSILLFLVVVSSPHQSPRCGV